MYSLVVETTEWVELVGVVYLLVETTGGVVLVGVVYLMLVGTTGLGEGRGVVNPSIIDSAIETTRVVGLMGDGAVFTGFDGTAGSADVITTGCGPCVVP